MNISDKRYLWFLLTYLKPQWYKLLILLVLLVTSIGIQLINPQLLKIFIDNTLSEGVSFSLLIIGVFYVALAIIGQGVSILDCYFGTNIAWTAMNCLRLDLVKHSLALDLGYHKSHSSGEMIERIDGDVNQLSNFFSYFLNNILAYTVLLISVLILFFSISWLLGISMLLFAISAFAILNKLRVHTRKLWAEQRQMSATFFGFLIERLEGAEDIRGIGAVAHTIRCFLLLRRQWFPINHRATRMTGFLFNGMAVLFTLGTILALSIAAYLWSIRDISVGTVYLIFWYTGMMMQPIQKIQSQLQDFQQAEACIKRIDDLLNTRSALSDGVGLPIQTGPLSVSFQHVDFGYEPEHLVLQDITFQVEPGKVLGVLGRTGSGKTTVARLLFRFHDSVRGEIRVGGVPIKDVHLYDLRARIGMVTQDVQLFHASVRDNLTFFDHDILDERIVKVLEEVGLTSWFETLEQGLNTILGSDGKGLSAGESQLLAFARVFLSDPDIIILDEASSRLDPLTAHYIEQSVDNLLKKRTVIIIAHRLSTVQQANDIMIMENGSILEYGSRQALISDPTSHFAQLLATDLEEIPT